MLFNCIELDTNPAKEYNIEEKGDKINYEKSSKPPSWALANFTLERSSSEPTCNSY